MLLNIQLTKLDNVKIDSTRLQFIKNDSGIDGLKRIIRPLRGKHCVFPFSLHFYAFIALGDFFFLLHAGS